MSREPAPEDPLYRDRVKFNAFEAADVDTPAGERSGALSRLRRRTVARASERQDPTSRAEVVRSGTRVPLVQGQVVERREEPKLVLLDAVNQCSTPATDRAVARSNVVRVKIYLESNPATVAGTAV